MDWELLKNISQWATVVFTILLGVPQLIKVIRDKKTGKVSFLSFWVLHIGIMMWVVYASISSSERPRGLTNVIIADGVSLLISTLTVWFLYYYKEGISKKTMIKVTTVLAVLLSITIILIFVWGFVETARISSNAAIIFSLIAPVFTAFAFSPQLIKNIRSKNWKGVSVWLYVVFTVNNIFWILFWISTIVLASAKGASYTDIVGALVWQTVSFVLYAYQLMATAYYNSNYYARMKAEKAVA